MDLKKELGKRVRQRREALRLTLSAVAEGCETAVSTIHRIEAGQLWPVAELFAQLHKVLDVPFGALVSDQDLSAKPTVQQAIEVLTDYVNRHPYWATLEHVPYDVIQGLMTAKEPEFSSIRAVLKGRQAAENNHHGARPVKVRRKGG